MSNVHPMLSNGMMEILKWRSHRTVCVSGKNTLSIEECLRDPVSEAEMLRHLNSEAFKTAPFGPTCAEVVNLRSKTLIRNWISHIYTAEVDLGLTRDRVSGEDCFFCFFKVLR